MIYLIDNYDSFSYNLYQMVGEIAGEMKVLRNDALSVPELAASKPSGIIISPGPGRPAAAGISEGVAKLSEVPILGVCLGHQAICEAFGAKIDYSKKLMHGKSSMINIVADCPLFEGLPERFEVGRYHSLAVDADSLPECLEVTAVTDEGEIMAVQHKDPLHITFGVQFHPESILTPDGAKILQNFVKLTCKN